MIKKTITLDEIPPNTSLYIYGSGKVGIRLKNTILKNRTDINILGFIDSFENGIVDGLKKICLDDFNHQDNAMIIVASAFSTEIANKLKKSNLRDFFIAVNGQQPYDFIFFKNRKRFQGVLLSIYELPAGCDLTILGSRSYCKRVSGWIKEYRKDIYHNSFSDADECLSALKKNIQNQYLVLEEKTYQQFESKIESLKNTSVCLLKPEFIQKPLDCLEPTVVYQAGKVASATIYKSLLPFLGKNEVFHHHHICPDMIEVYATKEFNAGNYQHIRHSSEALNIFYRFNHFKNLKIICPVRELIGRSLSELFHHIESFYPEFITSDGHLKKKKLLTHIQEHFINFKNCRDDVLYNWFKMEFEKTMGFSVFDYPFDKGNGYSVLHVKNKRVFLITLESLDHNFKQIGKFLNIDGDLNMIRSNVMLGGKYAQEYQYILGNLKLPQEVCRKIYDNSCMPHFYTAESIEAFTKKWSFSTKLNQSSYKKEHL